MSFPRRNLLGATTTRLGALTLGALLLLAAPAHADLQFKPGSFAVTDSTDQAGAYPDLTTSFRFLTHKNSTEGNAKDIVVDLPPGFAGDPLATPTCTAVELQGSGFHTLCPAGSQVGTVELTIRYKEEPEEVVEPLFNMTAAPGTAATLGFNFSGIVVQEFYVTVRPGDSGLRVTVPDINGSVDLSRSSVTVWGVPAAAGHDPQREQRCYNGVCNGGGVASPAALLPFLSNPTRCTTEPLTATIAADSWQQRERRIEASAPLGPMTGCEKLGFSPSFSLQPTTLSAYSPMGLNADLSIPQSWNTSVGLATSHLEKAVVTLPEGVSLNPSAGSGLGVCTPEQYASETAASPPGAGCPDDSKVGTVTVETPVLNEEATGAVYVAKPFENPFRSLLALYIVAKIPDRGIVVEVAGEVHADRETGQLTTTFAEDPQLPFSHFTLHFNQGATSPLVSPPTCGVFAGQATLTPWSEPSLLDTVPSSFEIPKGVDNGPCPSAATPPFRPELHAGTINNRAGSYSPFYIRLSRQDGEQEITHFSIKLPPGVVGKLAGIPFCSDAQIAQAKGREHEQGGAEEEANPSCPAASQVGRTIVEAGVGNTLAQAPGKIYLAGPYHGSAISVVSITDAKVGPFDLGTVVVREGLKVNPETGEVFVDATGSDPIPHIVDGIPVHLRDIRIYVNRPEFVLNPTSCEPTSTASTVLGSGLNFASEADDVPVTVSSPFQAADCAALGFEPSLKLSLKGKTNRGATPAFTAQLTMPPGDANIASSVVTLPHSEFLDNAHIGTSCTRVQFNAGGGNGEHCPAASIYGHARATTPILSEPLEGPVFLRSNGGERKLPDLVAALHGSEINIDLVGFVESGRGGTIRNTFAAVPDAPAATFTLEMAGGSKGLLQNSTDLCGSINRAISEFTAHNSKVSNTNPLVKPLGCHQRHGKGKGHGKHKRHG